MFSASWFAIMQWPGSVVSRYAFEKLRFLEMLSTRPHSARTLELVGVSGKISTVSGRSFRKWNELRVVMEHHYDQ